MTIQVEHGDCLEVIPQLVAEGVLVDAIVTDPPYHLGVGNQVIAWDTMPANRGRPKLTKASVGFMGQRWDGGDIAFRPETWAAIGAALKPGGYLLAFGGTRTHHRIWCAIEDAGFVVQDTIMWLYGSGFPKGRTQLKPAFEPICVAYKPGARTLQIDECRIGDTVETWPTSRSYVPGKKQPGRETGGHTESAGDAPRGRWPANVCHDGSDEVVEAFAAFGERRSAGLYPSNGVGTGNGTTYASRKPQGQLYEDSGAAARFFYCAKADVNDRWGSKHPTVKPVELIRWLVRLVTPAQGTVLDCFAGSGTTAVAAMAGGRNAILIEREAEYIADIRERVAHYEGSGRHSLAAKHRSRSNSSKPMPLLDLE